MKYLDIFQKSCKTPSHYLSNPPKSKDKQQPQQHHRCDPGHGTTSSLNVSANLRLISTLAESTMTMSTYPQHSLLLRNRSSDQVWVHLGLIIIELDVQKQQQHQQKLTAIGMLSVAIIIIIAMNKFSSNYYFRHFCNVPVWCSMQ